MTHAAESTHWYSRNGIPAYTVIGANGKERDTTLRDARKLALVPSVTTIIKCAAAPGLEIWKQNQVMLAAMTLQKRQDEPEVDYLKRVMEDSRAQAEKARNRGTAIHAAIQGFFQHETPDSGYMPHIQGVCAALEDWAGAEYDHECCIVERAFAHPLGFGGKVDIFGTAPWFVADFKTKEFGEDDDLKTWDEHAMQLAAYRVGQEMPQARCVIVYVSVTNPGLCRAIEIPEEDLVKGWKCFYSLLQFWKAKTGYECSFERELAA